MEKAERDTEYRGIASEWGKQTYNGRRQREAENRGIGPETT